MQIIHFSFTFLLCRVVPLAVSVTHFVAIQATILSRLNSGYDKAGTATCSSHERRARLMRQLPLLWQGSSRTGFWQLLAGEHL